MFNNQTPDQQEFVLPPLSHASDIPASQASEALPSITGYRITGSLGAGAMGTVWRAWQISTRRDVALKLMSSAAIGSGKARLRFEREVELTSQLEHPGIARLYDSGVFQNLYYYAMELVDGIHLDAYVKKNILSQQEILKLFHAICLALQHAHERGVIHRDLKPSNILVDVSGRPHVVDFGLAKREDFTLDASLISLNGDVAGTPAFMSPEQAAGKANGVDTRSDVYSLGVILYLLLTGQFPLDTSGSYVDVMHRVVNGEATPPRKISKAVDRDLQKIIMKAINKSPENRYSNAGALAADIDKYLHCEPVSAQSPTLAYVLKKKLWKHKVSATVGAGVVIVIGTIVIYASMQVRAEKNAAIAAAASESIQRKKADIATNLSDLRLADASLNLGDQLIDDGQWSVARPHLSQAKEIYRRLGASALLADVGLLQCFLHSPAPVIQLDSNKDPILSFTVSQDSRTALGMTHQGILYYSIPEGKQLASLRPWAGDLVKVIPEEADRPVVMAIVDNSVAGEGAFSTLSFQRGDQESPYLKLQLPGSLNTSHIVLSPTLHFVATTCIENTINQGQRTLLVLGDLSGATSARVIDSDAAGINAMDFSLDESHLVTADSTGVVKRWDLETFAAVPFAESSLARAGKLICLPDDNVLISTGDGSLSQWDLDRGRLVRRFISNGPEVTVLALSKDRALIAAGDVLGVIRVWSESAGTLVGCFQHNQVGITSLAFSPDGRTITSVNRGGTAFIWPVPGKYGSVSVKLDGEVTHMSISPHHRLSLMGFRNGVCVLSDTTSGNILCTLGSSDTPILDVGFSPDASQAVITHEDGSTSVYNLPSGILSSSLGSVPNSQLLVRGGVRRAKALRASILAPNAHSALEISSSEVILRNLRTDVYNVVAGRSMIFGGFSGDGDYAFVVDANRNITWIRTNDATAIGQVQGNGDPPACGAISDHGKLALLGSSDGTLTLIDLQARKQLWAVNLHGGGLRSISFCSDDHAALVTTDEGSAELWDIDNQRILNRLECDGMNVSLARISRDERMVAFQTVGDPMQFWNLDYSDIDSRRFHYVHDAQGNDWQEPSPDASKGLMYAALGFDSWGIKSFKADSSWSDPFDAFMTAGCYWRHGDLIAAGLGYKKAQANYSTTEDRIYADLCIQAIMSSPHKVDLGKQ